MAVIGHFEGRNMHSLSGWAWDDEARAPAAVTIAIDGRIDHVVIPDIKREDLRAHGLGDGGCAFEWAFPDDLYDGQSHHVEVLFQATGAPLLGLTNGFLFQLSNHQSLPPAKKPYDGAEMARRVAQIRWFHSFDFGNGVAARGHKRLRALEVEASFILPSDIKGKSCLDIGAWDGFFSFQAELRGARSVLATDHFSWSGPGWGTADGFRLARDLLDSDVADIDIDALDISESIVGRHDIVLFLGVLYHLRDPFEGLRAAASVCDDLLIVETTLHLHEVDAPSMRFFPNSELDGDATNWWSPNPACVIAMLEALDFQQIDFTPHPETRIGDQQPVRGIFHARR